MSPMTGLAVAAELPEMPQAASKNSQPLSAEATLVRNALIERGLETPMIFNGLSDEQKKTKIQARFTEILQLLGLDLDDDSLQDTPRRIAKMYVSEIFAGLNYAHFPKITVIENKMQVQDLVKVRGIDVSSTCEHHFITIDGSATVAYIPREKVIGLSKINRIVRFFAQRPQVQERLTEQVRVALEALLDTPDVAVSITARHFCVKARGIMDATSATSTRSLGGRFRSEPGLRADFMQQDA